MKTIFIIITRGFIVRNILRSGVLDHLRQAGLKIVIFFPGNKNELPDYLRKEFERDSVILEVVSEPRIYLYSFFAKWSGFLVYTKSTWMYSVIGNMKNLHRGRLWKYIESGFFRILSQINFLKTVARLIDRYYFQTNMYDAYFLKYQPSAVFSTSVVSKLDMFIMKTAQRYGVPTISMPKGWDNVTKMLYRFVPDRLIVQNQMMKQRAVSVQRIDEEKIFVTGFPQFDWYSQEGVLLTREEYFKKINVDPKRKLIFFGSEGIWAPDDDKVLDKIVEAINTPGTISHDSTLFIRPHFSDASNGRFNRFRGLPNVIVDENFTLSTFFMDGWDPGVEETALFTNLIFHCDILVTVASTLTLDGASTNRPLVNVAYGVLHHPETGEDLSPLLYKTDHYEWVLDTGAVDLVHSHEQLIQIINTYLNDPTRKALERKVLLERLCYRVDGNSSKRVTDVILKAL